MYTSRTLTIGILTLAFASFGMTTLIQEWKSGIVWPEPAIITPGDANTPPSDATVLFDGSNLDAWKGGENWKIEEGYAISQSGGIATNETFGDVQLHLEWASPEKVTGQGQGRGNSGVYFMGQYEVQILDSYENETYFDGQAGSIYKQSPPMVNACRPPGEWQTYDIMWTAPRFEEDGSVKSPAVVTVLHNGIVIQNNYELQGATHWHKPPAYVKHAETGPISLQFHGNPVRFRNIWVRNIKPIVGEMPAKETEAVTEN
ncbi:MAG: DUF1080 domain-containing protein [Planctomycetaceae bacterium]|jgi:hypothetical protein|nr:DUF1080 domain-containing protein [Planctomycetaceae bacterium]